MGVRGAWLKTALHTGVLYRMEGTAQSHRVGEVRKLKCDGEVETVNSDIRVDQRAT